MILRLGAGAVRRTFTSPWTPAVEARLLYTYGGATRRAAPVAGVGAAERQLSRSAAPRRQEVARRRQARRPGGAGAAPPPGRAIAGVRRQGLLAGLHRTHGAALGVGERPRGRGDVAARCGRGGACGLLCCRPPCRRSLQPDYKATGQATRAHMGAPWCKQNRRCRSHLHTRHAGRRLHLHLCCMEAQTKAPARAPNSHLSRVSPVLRVQVIREMQRRCG